MTGREPACRACAYFRNDPAWLETAITGLATMGSAWASVRAEDGICLRYDRSMSADGACAAFVPADDETPARQG